jgi:hypothetical protein
VQVDAVDGPEWRTEFVVFSFGFGDQVRSVEHSHGNAIDDFEAVHGVCACAGEVEMELRKDTLGIWGDEERGTDFGGEVGFLKDLRLG